MLFRIDGVNLKSPKDFSREKYKITKSKRLASGNMSAQYITQKHKILVKYDILSGTDLDTFMKLYDQEKFFYTVEYDYLNIVRKYTMYPGSLKYKDFRRDGIWYWKNVSFDFIER